MPEAIRFYHVHAKSNQYIMGYTDFWIVAQGGKGHPYSQGGFVYFPNGLALNSETIEWFREVDNLPDAAQRVEPHSDVYHDYGS